MPTKCRGEIDGARASQNQVARFADSGFIICSASFSRYTAGLKVAWGARPGTPTVILRTLPVYLRPFKPRHHEPDSKDRKGRCGASWNDVSRAETG